MKSKQRQSSRAVDARRKMVTASVQNRPVKEETVAERKEREKKEHRSASFKRQRGISTLFNKNYVILLLMTILLLVNCVGHAFKGDFEFIMLNLIFIGIFIFSLSYVDPLAFASDKHNYQMPKFNLIYNNVQKFAKILMHRIGKNLDIKPSTTLNVAFGITVVASLISILFYNSSFEIITYPIFLVYVCRVFISNKFKSEVHKITLFKWILFGLFVVDCIMSFIWRTSVDYSLFVMISLYNSTAIWFRNTEIYGYADNDFS